MRQTTFHLIVGIVAGLAIGYFLFHNCNRPKPCPEIKIEQKSTSDTAKQLLPKDSSQWHAPQMASITVVQGGQIPQTFTRIDSFTAFEMVHDTIADYKAVRNYSDTNHFNEGDVIVENTVYMNRLAKQRVLLDKFKQTVITNTVTNTVIQKQPPRAQLYLGIGGQYNMQDSTIAAGPSLMFKTKSDKAIELGAMINSNGKVMLQGSLKFKISFRNN